MTPWFLTVVLALSAQEAPVAAPEEAPVEAPVAEAPAEAPAQEEPAQQAPVEEPAKEAPAKEAPAKEAPVTEAAKEAPVAEAWEIGHNEGLLAFGTGVALGWLSVTAFAVGFEAERQLKAREVTGVEADQVLTQRTLAAVIAWPSAVLSLVGMAAGGYVLAVTEVEATVAGSGR